MDLLQHTVFILCCDKIISYYGRVSDSILCYTPGFNNNMKNTWIENNIRLHNTIKKHKKLIIKSLSSIKFTTYRYRYYRK